MKENDPNNTSTDATNGQSKTGASGEHGSSPLNFLADVALNSTENTQDNLTNANTADGVSANTAGSDDQTSQLRTLLEHQQQQQAAEVKKKKGRKPKDPNKNGNNGKSSDTESPVKNNGILLPPMKFIATMEVRRKEARIWTYEDTSKRFSSVNHTWYCEGRLLMLINGADLEDLTLFQEVWSHNQPVMVSGIDRMLEPGMWTPKWFEKKFGEDKHPVVDCRDNDKHEISLKKFWDGFENMAKRTRDKANQANIWKLKDWPPGDDFRDELPEHAQDIDSVMPIFAYTTPLGMYNLAKRLPETFVRPDLGPKLYMAYGPSLPDKGTTNLHLDVSDAVNVMCYVGVPKGGPKGEEPVDKVLTKDEVFQLLRDGGVDETQMKRVQEKGSGAHKVGALWHIFESRDVDKMREFLLKVAVERGQKVTENADPIHDQLMYLDAKLRQRLKDETGVVGYAIAQCLGDAVFIPAGAPHQVANINSCIKVAADFVSPENVAHCFNLTEQFRKLSDNHENHQDKLQIKNIMYHTVKDALSHFDLPTSATDEAVVPRNVKPDEEPPEDEEMDSE